MGHLPTNGTCAKGVFTHYVTPKGRRVVKM